MESFLRSDRVLAMVRHGGCSLADFRDIFKTNIERRVRHLPDIAGLTKDTVVSRLFCDELHQTGMDISYLLLHVFLFFLYFFLSVSVYHVLCYGQPAMMD